MYSNVFGFFFQYKKLKICTYYWTIEYKLFELVIPIINEKPRDQFGTAAMFFFFLLAIAAYATLNTIYKYIRPRA